MLTQQQIEKYRIKYGIDSSSSSISLSSAEDRIKKLQSSASINSEDRIKQLQSNILKSGSNNTQSYGQDTIGDIKQTMKGIGNAYLGTKKKIQDIANAEVAGEQGKLRSFGQSFGAIAGGISKGIGEVVKGTVKTILPPKAEEGVKKGVETAISTALPVAKAIDDALGQPVGTVIKKYNALPAKSKRDVDAVLGVGSLALDASMISGGIKGVNALSKQVGKVGANIGKTTVKIGEQIDDVVKAGTKVIKSSGGYVQERVPKLLGIFSGENDDVIKQALRNPEAAKIGVSGGDDALREVVKEGAKNSVKLKNSFVSGFKQSKDKIMGIYTKILIPKNNIVGKFKTLLKENGVTIGKNGKLDFTKSLIQANPGEIKKINDAFIALRKWDKFTIDSLDEYKQLIGKLTTFATDAGKPSKSPFLGRLYNELNEIAYSKLPKNIADKYRIINKQFSENIGLYDDIVKAFNSGDPFTKLANSLGKNKDKIRQILDFYEKQSKTNVLAKVAGRELAMEKNAAFGFLNPRSWIDFFISPKLQGEAVIKVGEKLNKLKLPKNK